MDSAVLNSSRVGQFLRTASSAGRHSRFSSVQNRSKVPCQVPKVEECVRWRVVHSFAPRAALAARPRAPGTEANSIYSNA